MSIPSATYRVQLHAGFNFRQLDEIIGYLHRLGISTIYASPITTAFTGSQHGYDVTDPLVINPEIGTLAELEKIAGRLENHKMDWLQDIVPNHMAYDSGNSWLCDVLERGKDSPYYGWFDIDEDPAAELIGDKIMAPFLGSTLTECLQQGDITLQLAEKGFVIRYLDKDYPVAAGLYPWIITLAEGYPPALASSVEEWEKAIHLPAAGWIAHKDQWLQRVGRTKEWKTFTLQRISFINGRMSLLEELLQSQHYILTHAHLAASHINYRRFFTVNSLICLRMEKEETFNAYHELLHQLYRKKLIRGLRIDHIDGLAAPGPYIDGLRRLLGPEAYIVAEKILGWDEALPPNWDLQGTTGYEFLAFSGQLLTDRDGAMELQAFYRDTIAGDMPPYPDLVFGRKLHFLRSRMGGEWNNLTDLLVRQQPPAPAAHSPAVDRERIKQALGFLMAAFPVYRLYPETAPLPASQQDFLREAFSRAREKARNLSSAPAIAGHLSAALDLLEQWIESPGFFPRLMQFTGPLAAKGIEDTCFYIYNPLIALNEVGNSPAVMGIGPAEFHARMTARQATHPYALNATTTHDTKRGEDSRVRLQCLTAMPGPWREAVSRWMDINRPFTANIDGQRIPSLNDEYLVYQSLLGGIPADLFVSDSFRQRFHEYLGKALREADTHTSYDAPNEAYENKCHTFVTAILQSQSAFLEDFIPFADRVIRDGMTYSLSQLLLKLTAPGIPDIYEGSECWELSFVDPDNRRPVDYDLRKYLLDKMREEEAKGWPDLMAFIRANQRKGATKLFMMEKVLAWRKGNPLVFTAGDYLPLETEDDSTLSYIRRYEKDWALIVVPLIRKERGLTDAVHLNLPAGAPAEWTNLFTGENRQGSSAGAASGAGVMLEISSPFGQYPAVMLTGKSE